jgi:hypothetical protein
MVWAVNSAIKRCWWASAAMLLFYLPSAQQAQAHGGGLDASGCHNDRKRGGYHCHRGGPSIPSPVAQEVPRMKAPVERVAAPAPISFMASPPTPTRPHDKTGGIDVTLQSDQQAYWVEGGWRVFSYPDEESCEIGVKPKEGMYLTLKYLPRDSAAYLMVMNDTATSRADGERVSLDIAFINDTDVTRLWDDTPFTVRVMQNGSRAMVSEPLAEEFLTRFALDRALAVTTQTRALVGGSVLEGSAKAIEQLRKCAFEAAKLNPADPFLQK